MLEIRTIFVSSFLIDLSLVVVLFMTWIQHREKFAGVGMWTMSLVCPTLTLVLVSLRGLIPDFFSIVVALGLLPLGCLYMIRGFERFFDLKETTWIHIVLFVLYLPMVVYYTYLSPSIHMRVFAFNAVTAIQYLIGFHLLSFRTKEEYRALGKLSSILLVSLFFCNSWRIYLALLGELNSPPMTTHILDPLPLLLIQVFTVMLVISWLMMVSQRHSSELSMARQEIERSEKRYKALVENSPTGIAIIDQNEIIRYANSQFSRLLKLNPEEVVGKNFKQYVAPESMEMCVNIFRDRQAGTNGVPMTHEVAILGPSGRLKYVEVHGAILEKTEDYCHTLVQAVDITARKKSEIALMDYQLNLENMIRGSSASVIHGSDADA